MSLDQARAFYQALDNDPVLYSQYLSHCSSVSELMWLSSPPQHQEPMRRWDESEILNFAQQRGYCFSLGELYQVWFGQSDYRTADAERAGEKMGAIATLNRQLA